jgi:hypothetical protein
MRRARPMPRRLREEEVVTVQVLAEKGQNHCEIARVLGITEGASAAGQYKNSTSIW